MTWETWSTQSTIAFARSPSAAAAEPKNTEKITICNISLLAIASNTLRGTRCVTNSLSESDDVLRFADAAASGSGRLSEAPGCSRLQSVMPSTSEQSEATTNHPIV